MNDIEAAIAGSVAAQTRSISQVTTWLPIRPAT